MIRQSSLLVLALLILTPIANAQNTSTQMPVTFELRNTFGNNILDTHVSIELQIESDGQQVKYDSYQEKGRVTLILTPGRWNGTIGMDDPTTLGSDYVANVDFEASQGTVQPTLIPVGSVTGIVYDEQGRVISNAKIGVHCQTYRSANVRTDEFGTFFINYVAPGNCQISALHGDSIGTSVANVRPQSTADLNITLNKQVVDETQGVLIGLITGLSFLGIGGLILYLKRPKTITAHREPSAEITNELMNTLKERERMVVEFLLKNNNAQTQNQIRYGTGLPKTTLVRIFDSLAARNIVSIQKVGKAKNINLTQWFLGEGPKNGPTRREEDRTTQDLPN